MNHGENKRNQIPEIADGLGFGIFLLLAGTALLAERLGWITDSISWGWPFILIAWGISVILKRLK